MVWARASDVPQEIRRLAGGRFGIELAKLPLLFAAPLFWVEGSDNTASVVRHGTTFFLDRGQGPFGVTAAHVMEALTRFGGDCTIGYDRHRFRLQERRIDSDTRLDVATYRISPEEIARVGFPVLTVGPARAQRTPVDGDVALFAGFPVEDRTVPRLGHVSFIRYSGGGRIQVGKRQIAVSVEDEREFMLPLDGFVLPRAGYNVGGLSGAPMLVLDRGSVLSWWLGGVVTDADSSFETIFAARAEHIGDDGRLTSP